MSLLRGFPCKTDIPDLLSIGRNVPESDRVARVRNLNTELDNTLTKLVPTLASKLYLDFNGKFLNKLAQDITDALAGETYSSTDLDFLSYLILCAEKSNVLLAHSTFEAIFKKSPTVDKDEYLHGIVSSDGDARIIPTVTIQTVDLQGEPVSLVIYLGEFSAQLTLGQWDKLFLQGLNAFTDKSADLELSYGGGPAIYLANGSTKSASGQPDFWGNNYFALKKWIVE